MADVLVLAGDILPFAQMKKHEDFFRFLSSNFKTTYWLPGNHEYYHFDLAEKSGALKEAIQSNLFLVNNTSVLHEGVRLIFSTLWSHISPRHQWQIENSLNDFHLIQHQGHRYSVEQYNQLHAESLAFIHKELIASKEKQTLVFTHHCPSFFHYPEQYKGSPLNEAFAVELHDFIESSGISGWVYGHHHTNSPEFTIGNTLMMTNQLGYVQQNEHRLFNTKKVLEI